MDLQSGAEDSRRRVLRRSRWNDMTPEKKQRLLARVKVCGVRKHFTPENMSKDHLENATRMTQMAVDFYNNNHQGDEIQLVEFLVLDYDFINYPVVYINFMAKPKSADCPDQSPKLFFSQLKSVGIKDYEATTCTTLGEDAVYVVDDCARKIAYPKKQQ